MRIYLRPVTSEDGHLIVKWKNSPEISDFCFDKTPLTIEMNEQFYKSFVETGKFRPFIVERIEENFGVSSYPIAMVCLNDMDYVNRRCQLCISNSDDQEWNAESRSIAIRLLLEKAFVEYNMHKVYTFVFANSRDEVDMMLRAGLKEEAVLKNEVINGAGEYVDILRLIVLQEDYKEEEKNEQFLFYRNKN